MASFQVRWITLLASMVGSAWPGSPWARMHAAHSSSSWVGLLLGSAVDELPLPPRLPLLVAKVVLVPRLATCGEPDPPPHAANPMAAAAAMRASPPARRMVVFWCAFLGRAADSSSGQLCLCPCRGRSSGCPAVASRHGRS